jgi:hypothetical protein
MSSRRSFVRPASPNNPSERTARAATVVGTPAASVRSARAVPKHPRRPLDVLASTPLQRLFVAAPVVAAAVLVTLVGTYGIQDPTSGLVALAWVGTVVGFTLFLGFVDRVPHAFETIRHRGIMGASFDWETFYRSTERDLHHRAIVAFAVFAACAVLVGWFRGIPDFATVGPRQVGWSIPAAIEVLAAMSLASLGAVGLSCLAVVGGRIHAMGKHPELRTQPDHPDRCGGLGPLGQLCLWNAFILAVPATILSLWIIGNPAGTNTVHVVLCAIVVLLAAAAFFFPLRQLHIQMTDKAQRLVTRQEQRAPKVDRLTKELALDGWMLSRKRFARKYNELEQERAMYQRIRQVPRWPVTAGHIYQLVVSLFIPVVGAFVGIVQLVVGM